MIEFKVLEISSFKDGCFKAIGLDGRTITCYLHNKDRDWDELCSYLGKTIGVKGSIMTRDSFLVMEICK